MLESDPTRFKSIGTPPASLQYAAITDIGMRRTMNQDAHGVIFSDDTDWRKIGHLFIVADGMGAHAAGEYASILAVEEVICRYRSSCESELAAATLTAALQAANASLHVLGQEKAELYNMGTTCSLLALLPQGAMIGHVGDSRIYRCRNEQIEQLTFDHSLVWEMRAAGQLRGHEHEAIVPRNVITRCLGPQPDVTVDVEGPFSVSVGDQFLLCTDGLTGRVLDGEIGTIMNYLPCDTAAQFLVDLANLRGGTDNITVQTVTITDEVLAVVHSDHVDRLGMGPPYRLPGQHWGTLLVMSLVATLASAWLRNTWGAASAAVIMVAIGIWMVVNRFRPAIPRSSARSHAGGPYARASTILNQRFLDGLRETFAEALEELNLPQETLGVFTQRIMNLSLHSPSARRNSSELSQLCQEAAEIARQLMTMVRNRVTPS